MSKIFGPIIRIASSVLEIVTLRARKKAKQERRADAEAPVHAAEEIRQAVAEGDTNKVNQLLEESRLHITHGGRAVSVALAALALAGTVFSSGCMAPRNQLVLSADRAVVEMEMNGIKGYFVPKLMFADLAAAYRAEQARLKLREEAMEAANGDF